MPYRYLEGDDTILPCSPPLKSRRLNLEEYSPTSLGERQRAQSVLYSASRGDHVLGEVISVSEGGELQISVNVEGVELTGQLQEVRPGQHPMHRGVTQQQPSVIIIGAGFAGLSAAEELHALGCKVVVVEARNRVGGRCWTDDLQGRMVDMGAGWIHGVDGNPLAELARRHGADLYDIPSDTVIHGPDGTPVPAEDDELVERLFNSLLRRAQDEASQKIEDESLGHKLNSLLQTEGGLSSSLQKQIFQWHCANVEYSTATDIHNLSVRNWAVDDAHAFGGEHCLLKQGYESVARSMAQCLDVRLGCEVTSVDHSFKSGETCRVHLTGGAFLESDLVLVTLPLGVLKSKRVAFNPPFPRWKQDAIDRMGFGLLNKIVLAFDECFWQSATPKGKYIGYASEVKGEFYMFIDVSECVGKPTLLALVSGTVARTLETCEDKQIISEALQVLGKVVTPSVMPDPCGYRITRWGTDPYALGSYSYVSVGCTADDMDALAVPLDTKKVYFAGEATNSEHPSTVHGAYMSGRRAARDILQFWRGDFGRDPYRKYDTFLPEQEDGEARPVKVCGLCGISSMTTDSHDGEMIGPFVMHGSGAMGKESKAGLVYVHAECAMFSPEVGRDRRGWYNVVKAVKRGRALRCTACKRPGATIGCQVKTCRVTMHRHCCTRTGWNFNLVYGEGGKAFFCVEHRQSASL